MDFKFSKGPGDTSLQEPPAEKKSQSALLVLLLLLVGGFSYLYFFTGLIKPPEAPKPVETAAPPVVKMPLPPRDGGAAAVTDKAKDQARDAAAKAQAPQPTQAPAVATPVVPVVKVPPQPLVKPKVESQKPELAKTVEKKPVPAPAGDKQSQKAVVAKVEEKKPVSEKKPLVTAKKTETEVKPANKKPADRTVKHKKSTVAATAATKEGAGDSWSLLVGNYVLEEALSVDLGRVRKAGLTPVVKAGARKKSAMNRLLFAEFTDRDAAQSAIAKLKRHTSDAFMIEQGGKQFVYAGSYLLDARAASEKERLNAAGFSVTLKRADVTIPTQSLTVGPFNDKKAADAALSKLKSVGIKATPVHP